METNLDEGGNDDGPYCLVYGKNATLKTLEDSGPSAKLKEIRQGKAAAGKSISLDVSRISTCSTSVSEATNGLRGINELELGKAAKEQRGTQRLRWNLVFNVMLWVLLPLPIWLPFVDAHFGTSVYLFLIPGIQLVFVLFLTLVALLAAHTALVLYKNRDVDFVDKMDQMRLKYDDIQHLVVLAVYKEPLDIICTTIDTLATQAKLIKRNTTLVIGFEERTPDLHAKEEAICDKFRNDFKNLVFSIHSYGVEGEIPGKCSNSNCAMRTGVAHLKKVATPSTLLDLDNVIITNGDSDNMFHPRYLEALTYKFLTTKNRKNCIYQAPLLYNWNLDASTYVTRVTGMLRAFLMQGALIPLNINTMSVFSFTASLAEAGDYAHPAYQMDDIICLIRWMGVTQKRLRVACVPVPVVSGLTAGRTPEDDLWEWARQAKRWTIGAGEVFHYFMVKAWGIPFLTALSWGILFIFYYGVVLCCSSLYGLLASLSVSLIISHPSIVDLTYNDVGIFNATTSPDFSNPSPNQLLGYIMLAFLIHQYFFFLVVFIVDKVTLSLIRPRMTEGVSLWRNVLHFVLAPLVLLAYSVVELAALHELAIKGKEVCSHKPSVKDQLGAPVSTQPCYRRVPTQNEASKEGRGGNTCKLVANPDL